MFDATRLLFIYVETPLHAGSGRGLGAIDLPIQRERTTQYPMIQASSLKGKLRAMADPASNPQSLLDREKLFAIFGPETPRASEHAGALSVGDARLLLFPVRSLAGVFAWTTSLSVLARFQRDAQMAGLTLPWTLLPEVGPGANQAWISGDTLVAGNVIVLEEFSFRPDRTQTVWVRDIGDWLARNGLPQSDEYAFWRQALPAKLCILPDNVLRDFVLYSTEVQTHIKLDSITKTVDATTGALWTVESLPADSLLYAPLMATPSRRQLVPLSGAEILDQVANLLPSRAQLGGDETTGHGMTALRIKGGAA